MLLGTHSEADLEGAKDTRKHNYPRPQTFLVQWGETDLPTLITMSWHNRVSVAT